VVKSASTYACKYTIENWDGVLHLTQKIWMRVFDTDFFNFTQHSFSLRKWSSKAFICANSSALKFIMSNCFEISSKILVFMKGNVILKHFNQQIIFTCCSVDSSWIIFNWSFTFFFLIILKSFSQGINQFTQYFLICDE
jgi:hypothetical protein